MRKGGSPAKGAAWERAVGKELSLWLTNNERTDIFARNATSGAAFTIALNKGKKSSRMPGDLMAAHPEAFDFLSKIAVECKHMATLALENFLFDFSGKSPMTKILNQADTQARAAGLVFMVIAKQNRRDPIVIVPANIGSLLLRSIIEMPTYHVLHRNEVFVMRFRDMITMCDAKRFLSSFRIVGPAIITESVVLVPDALKKTGLFVRRGKKKAA